jgi:hypothetical protein
VRWLGTAFRLGRFNEEKRCQELPHSKERLVPDVLIWSFYTVSSSQCALREIRRPYDTCQKDD